jgi:23S rRNA pseudouridine2605 synthase
MPVERLNKVLAHAGLGSRRQCDELIAQGRVTVGRETVTELGSKVDIETADVRCDGVPVRAEGAVHYLVNKPVGVVCTNARNESRPRVIDMVRKSSRRLYTVGRLDEDSRGLIIVTNDGELTQQLTHPSHRVPKTYRVRVKGNVIPRKIEAMKEGVPLSEGKVALPKVKVVSRRRGSTDLEVQLHQGINRQIRRVLAKVGHPVIDLQRVAIGPIRDPGLREGAFRRLKPHEVGQLRELSSPTRSKKR